ncbi:Nodulin-related protein 1, putative [Theobroma cacao]|uniref:Nodulin-related protein 1, putative n=2 Tax=Theobroma cacao TaxID=3641 RepID=A0A061E9U2_THECC|nr:Nodulin-related protein 1, putative [Theobroma cacao]
MRYDHIFDILVTDKLFARALPDLTMASEKDRTPTSSELFSSAKVVAGAAKSTFSNESDKVDKGKVAGAAADLLGAAKGYGKLDQEKGIGQYVDKAENYLHQYESSGATPGTKKSDTPTNPEPAKSEPHASGGDGKDSGSAGVGDYVKVAQGFFK